jgi:serine-type D-Ala-D-Ala endopeptidase (penicillin-binding protein 7)
MSINFMKKNLPKIIIVFLFLSLFGFKSASAASVLDVVARTPVYIAVSDEVITPPWEYSTLTPIFKIKNEKLVNGKTYSVEISYSKKDNNYKRAFYFDKIKNVWKPLPTVDNPKTNKVKVEIPFASVDLAIFSHNTILTVGRASWYNYKKGLFAASPDFGKGSILRVYNLANGKYVDVTINDFGPERSTHPDRVVDLDKVAFKKIAATSVGTINIRIEILKSVGKDLNKEVSLATEPTVSAWSAVVMRESDGKILWDKNSEKVSPLASLTKIIAAQVFLDTKPTLSRVVTYLKQDENYNYLYCKPGESAKLKVSDGETMTLQDLLYSALVGSANNAIESLVRNSGLTRDEFITKMNDKVQSWGASSTSFVEPTGLSEKNMSSPADYAIITKAAYANPLIQKISITSKYTFSTINTKVKHTINNTDKLIAAGKYNIIGSKTGYLDEARYCLMTRVKTVLGNLIVVNFGSTNKNNNFSDNEKLINYGLQLLKI